MATRMSDLSVRAGGVKADKRTFKRRARIIAPVAMALVLLLAGLFLFCGLQRKGKECMARCACMADGCQPQGRPDAKHTCGQCSQSGEAAHNQQG